MYYSFLNFFKFIFFTWKKIKCVILSSMYNFLTFFKYFYECVLSQATCSVEKPSILLKEAPLLSGFLAVTSCLPSPSLTHLTNEIPSLTHLTNDLWRGVEHGQAMLYVSGGAGWGRPLRFLF